MPKSTKQRNTSKAKKPHKDFPLWVHPSGRWAKKVKGRTHYFGKYRARPKWRSGSRAVAARAIEETTRVTELPRSIAVLPSRPAFPGAPSMTSAGPFRRLAKAAMIWSPFNRLWAMLLAILICQRCIGRPSLMNGCWE